MSIFPSLGFLVWWLEHKACVLSGMGSIYHFQITHCVSSSTQAELHNKQAGNGTSRRRLSLKNSKRLHNVKVFVNWGHFGGILFWKKVSQCQKTERGDPLGFFNIHSVAKHQKN